MIDLPLQWGQLLSDEEVNVSPIIPLYLQSVKKSNHLPGQIRATKRVCRQRFFLHYEYEQDARTSDAVYFCSHQLGILHGIFTQYLTTSY